MSLLLVSVFFAQNGSDVVIDSDYNFEQALEGLEFPSEIKKQLQLIDVYYY